MYFYYAMLYAIFLAMLYILPYWYGLGTASFGSHTTSVRVENPQWFLRRRFQVELASTHLQMPSISQEAQSEQKTSVFDQKKFRTGLEIPRTTTSIVRNLTKRRHQWSKMQTMLCSALPLTILLRLDPFEMQRPHFNNTTDTPTAQTLTTTNYYTKTPTHRSLYTQHRSSTDHLNHPLTLDRQHHNHMQPISRSVSQCKTLHINQNPGPKDHKSSLKNFLSPNRYTQYSKQSISLLEIREKRST